MALSHLGGALWGAGGDRPDAAARGSVDLSSPFVLGLRIWEVAVLCALE